MKILDHIRVVPDFPKAGINFYDIATLLADPPAWRETIGQLAQRVRAYEPDLLMGIESRGFLVAAPLALELGIGFGMVRKAGKLPGDILSLTYDLEYGTDTIEVQPDLIPDGAKVVIIDDLLATGGTISASEKLIAQAGGIVEAAVCIVELEGLNGRDKISCSFESLFKCPA